MPEMHELLPMVMSGELTPEEAGDAFRKNYIDFRRRNAIDPNKYKPFDQMERRLIMGVPVVEKRNG